MLSSEDETPIISVVVICFNDSDRLPAAIRSVLRQTFSAIEVIVVDDHSSDSTPDVVAQLALEDSRVRSIRLPENSGGCGMPRNTGFASARGRYVMFLDSDDVLTPDACMLLATAADSSGADFVAGSLRRVHQESGQIEPWYAHLYDSVHVYKGLAERPELVYDTVATNKLYRREFLSQSSLTFPTDMHYEDVVFTAQVLSCASVIHYIPELVYEWRVYGDETRLTITNQRTKPSNYSDRARAVDQVREIYRGKDRPVRVAADVKALRHHLTLHLRDAPELSDNELAAMLETFAPFVSRVLPAAIEELSAFERTRFAALLLGDPQLVRASLREEALGVARGELVGLGDEARWHIPGSVLADSSPARRFLGFPGARGDEDLPVPFRKAAIITKAGTSPDSGLTLSGYIESRGAMSGLSGVIMVLDGETVTGSVPTTLTRSPSGKIRWRASISRIRASRLRRRVPLRLVLEVEGTRLPVFTEAGELPLTPDGSPIGSLLGDSWLGQRAEDGKLEFHAVAGPMRSTVRRLVQKLR